MNGQSYRFNQVMSLCWSIANIAIDIMACVKLGLADNFLTFWVGNSGSQTLVSYRFNKTNEYWFIKL